MRTYELKKTPRLPLYEALYQCIRQDILSGELSAGEKLPSKRALAANLKVSKITVEGAYQQLLEEGYIRAREKVGYFVEPQEQLHTVHSHPGIVPEPAKPEPLVDLTGNGPAQFPFSVWSRLQRQVMLDQGETLLLPLENQGCSQLRRAIADHLADFRGMQVDPQNILIGAGTDFLYNLLIQLLGRDKVYALEDPGYAKIAQIYQAGGVQCVWAGLDAQGIRPEELENAQVLHISPSHHFPTGIVTGVNRRMELLEWANAKPDRYIIEDDYDSEFRFTARPKPTIQSLDRNGRVIYMNTFSKTLAPSIRISYMVLPPALMAQFQRTLGFYSCTVPSFEQYTLARFLSEGHFEKHINRMRKSYRILRNQVIHALQQSRYAPQITILEQDAGLHFLVQLHTELSDEDLIRRCSDMGIRIRALSSYYHQRQDRHALVVNYSGLRQEDLPKLIHCLSI